MGKSVRLLPPVLALASLLVLCVTPAVAGVTPEEAAALGTELTPFGADRAGNEAGTIPPWHDGSSTSLPNLERNGPAPYPDPYATDPLLFSITADQADGYEEKLSPGQRALLAKYKGSYRIDVFPSHRPQAAPPWVYENTAENAQSARTSSNGDGLKGASAGIPFPIPKTGAQVMWNHLLRWEGAGFRRSADSFVVEFGGGLYPVVNVDVWHKAPYYVESDPGEEADGNYANLLYEYIYPPDWKGTLLLVKDRFTATDGARKAWLYEVGQRRVRPYVSYSYDNPNRQLGGVVGVDDKYMFNGPLDHFDWKLVGKREIYIPYNCYKADSGVAPQELFQEAHVDPAYVRWELHRTWIVEAVRRKGQTHMYARRVFYVDEDSWNIVLADAYDDEGSLWRTSMALTVYDHDLPGIVQRLTVHLDLRAGRYTAFRPGPATYGSVRPDSFFTAEQLRGMGRR